MIMRTLIVKGFLNEGKPLSNFKKKTPKICCIPHTEAFISSEYNELRTAHLNRTHNTAHTHYTSTVQSDITKKKRRKNQF